MIQRPLLLAYAAACLALTLLATRARAQPQPPAQQPQQRFVDLPAAGELLAVNPDGGAVAIASASERPGTAATPLIPGAAAATADTVTLYPNVSTKASAADPVTRKLPGGLIAGLAFKRMADGKSALVVLCQGDRTIHLLDPATLEPVGKPIPLKATARPYGLAVPARGDAPYAFYIAGTQHDARPWRVNLATGADEGRVQTQDSVRSPSRPTARSCTGGGPAGARRASTRGASPPARKPTRPAESRQPR